MTEVDAREWTDEGAFEVAPGTYRIPLPLPLDALRAVNVYAIVDGSRLTLIDGGWAITEARDQLVRSLATLGFALGDIRRFLVTHVHRDHYTQSIAIRRIQGTPVALGEHERTSLEEMIRARERGQWRYAGWFRMIRAGASDIGMEMARKVFEEPVEGFNELPDMWLQDQQVLDLDDRSLTVVHTPGHTAGHVVFDDAQTGVLFAGDHVLPHITPSIGLETAPVPSPLADYLSSLARVRNLPDRRLLPAHGPVRASVHERVDELLAHHEERLDLAKQAVAAGATSAYEVATIPRWTRRNRHLEELDLRNAAMAIAETLAHLDVLVSRRELDCVSGGGDNADRFIVLTERVTDSR